MTTTVYVIVPPGDAVGDPGVSVIATSAASTVTLVVAVSFPRLESFGELTVTRLEIVVFPAVPGFTVTTMVKVAVVLAARFPPSVQVTLPVLPRPGFVHPHPAGKVTDLKVVLPGVACTQLGVVEVLRKLLFLTLIV